MGTLCLSHGGILVEFLGELIHLDVSAELHMLQLITTMCMGEGGIIVWEQGIQQLLLAAPFMRK